MSRNFQLVDAAAAGVSVQHVASCPTNWEICVICQNNKSSQPLQCPAASKKVDAGSGYRTLAETLIRFSEIKALPNTLQLDRLDDGTGVESTMAAHKAKWHKSCVIRYNSTALKRAEKRVTPTKADNTADIPQKRARTRPSSSNQDSSVELSCFFCGHVAGTDGLHESSTFQLDRNVRAAAATIEDNELLSRLSTGDMVALEAKYHTKCLLALYDRAKKVKKDAKDTGTDDFTAGIAFAELVMFIEDTHLESNIAPVFRLADLAQMYKSRLEQLAPDKDNKSINTTRLKQRLLTQIPELRAQSKGRDVLLAFDDDIGIALGKACDKDNDSDAIHLARAARIVREAMFREHWKFNGSFTQNCQEKSVPKLLLALVNMVLEGPSINEQNLQRFTPAALAIAQLLRYNCVKHLRDPKKRVISLKHSPLQETPLPIYLGLLLHAKTRKKGIVERFSELGLSITYDRMLHLSAEMGNSVCQYYRLENVVCPPSLHGNLFTTSAVDNIDHNPSATTAKDSFHGTAISLFQHPSNEGDGTDRGIAIITAANTSKTVCDIPHFYADVPPVDCNIKGSEVPTVSISSLKRYSYGEHTKKQDSWLEHTRCTLEDNEDTNYENISWPAYLADKQIVGDLVITPTALLPLFQEAAHSLAMIRHSMDVVRSAITHLNSRQTPVMAFDQPLFTIAKRIQWKWPERYGEDQFVIMFGGLHIEMVALKTIGDWLNGSGWTNALVQADVTTTGTADSFLKAAHVSRTRMAHQITVATLYILQHRAYKHYCENNAKSGHVQLDFDIWCKEREEKCPQFQYWSLTIELELYILIFVQSLREADFSMYLDALTELVPWFFALDHTNYARWIPVHLRDMAELSIKHPDIHTEFTNGNLTVHKTTHRFSAIGLDHAHEQNNACIKGDGGAIGLTENPSALRRWMIAGPEISRVVQEFERTEMRSNKRVDTRHHDQLPSVQKRFAKDVTSLVAVIEEFGNPFKEESHDLIVLDTKEIASPEVITTVRTIQSIGQERFKAFTDDCLINRTKSIDDVISLNKLPLFSSPKRKSMPKGKQKLISLKNDVTLFSRLYIGCQTRDGDLEEFFRHENQACPPAISEAGKLYLGKKSDLLSCLEEHCEKQAESPNVSSVVLDGAVIVQILKPGAAKTFLEYANDVFIPYILCQLRHTKRLDLVWDSYKSDSLKATARAKRGKGTRRRVVESAPVPGNWQDFLRVDDNKTELFSFLSNQLIRSADPSSDKELVVTCEELVLTVPIQQDCGTLEPCSHEEADSRMLLHVSHAAKHGHSRILVRTVDTDVVVISVMEAQIVPEVEELWLAFGTGKGFRYLAIHQMANSLGPEKSKALPMFHALTGCDSVSAFVGHGKKGAWGTWNTFPELTDALLTVATAPPTIPDQTLSTIERFVVLLYDRTSRYTDVNIARKKLFAKRNSVQCIPPSKYALVQHVKRAVFQGGHVWGQTLVTRPLLPPPCNWGWLKSDEGLFEPSWITIPEASKICAELISCGCKKGCRNRCKCKRAALQCTGLCTCEGTCNQRQ